MTSIVGTACGTMQGKLAIARCRCRLCWPRSEIFTTEPVLRSMTIHRSANQTRSRLHDFVSTTIQTEISKNDLCHHCNPVRSPTDA